MVCVDEMTGIQVLESMAPFFTDKRKTRTSLKADVATHDGKG